jgi:hydrogenase maturation protease
VKILVAGIGNIFLGDDGFGVEVAQRLAKRSLPDGVKVVDFGIRGLDLVYALLEDFEAVIFVDIAAHGEAPGTLYLIEPEIEADAEVTLEAHGMEPAKVLALAQSMGAPPRRTLLVACEPAQLLPGGNYEDVLVELSTPVRAAIAEAIAMVEALIAQFSDERKSDSREEKNVETYSFIRSTRGSSGDAVPGISGHHPLFENEVHVA